MSIVKLTISDVEKNMRKPGEEHIKLAGLDNSEEDEI
jgi:hypothetical protein